MADFLAEAEADNHQAGRGRHCGSVLSLPPLVPFPGLRQMSQSLSRPPSCCLVPDEAAMYSDASSDGEL